MRERIGVLLPAFALVVSAIFATTPGPVMFRQTRFGTNPWPTHSRS